MESNVTRRIDYKEKKRGKIQELLAAQRLSNTTEAESKLEKKKLTD